MSAVRIARRAARKKMPISSKDGAAAGGWQRAICASCGKDRAIFLSAAANAGDERGWSTFWHHQLVNHRNDDGPDRRRDDRVLKSHTNVVYQPPVGHPHYSGLNPTRSASRCTPTSSASARRRPTRTAHGSPPSPAATGSRRSDHAMRNFSDESFVGQYLSPKLMRDFASSPSSTTSRRASSRSRPSTTRRLPRGARGALAPVRPGQPQAQHPGLEREPARRPLTDPAPHPAQRPPAARHRAGSAQARGAAVGLRRAPRQRQQPRRD